MDYKKKYNEALRKIRELIERGKKNRWTITAYKKDFEHIFPELKESEGEKVNRILHSISSKMGSHLRDIFTEEEFQCFDAWSNAWLEKQGSQKLANSAKTCKDEQKTTDNVEAKFKVGKWIVWLNKCYKVNDNGCGYELIDQNGLSTSLEYGTVDERAHFWTIQDAKDGDVLAASDGSIFIFKEVVDTDCKHYIALVVEDGTIQVNDNFAHCWESVFGVCPATKEQSDLLFQKMKEAGYEWDAGKKELKKIPNALEEREIVHVEHGKCYYCIKDYYAGGNKRASKGDVVMALNGMSMMDLGVEANEYFIPVNNIELKPAEWSEEDKVGLDDALWCCKQAASIAKDENDMGNAWYAEKWLKSLKERIGG